MPRDGAIIFSDLIGKLDVLRVACAKCTRSGRYQVQRLIEERGAATQRSSICLMRSPETALCFRYSGQGGGGSDVRTETQSKDVARIMGGGCH
jgi:hypothetical protein